MEHLTLKGLVIRETDFGDSDRYISVLTESGRRIEVLCKGVRRRGGRMINAVRLFCYSELTLYAGRGGKYTLTQADLIASFWGVTESMETYALCCYLAELVGHMTDTEEDSPAATRLLLYALRAVADQKRDRLLVKAALELRLMAESGYAPDWSACSACGQALQDIWFSPRDGVCRCAACAARLGTPGYVHLLPATFSAFSHILMQEIPRVYAFALSGPARLQLAQIGEAYALCRAERGFDSLTFYHSLEPEGGIPSTWGART
nr:DNA repair protein RecO [uncultured Butyricicoccus sp.]